MKNVNTNINTLNDDLAVSMALAEVSEPYHIEYDRTELEVSDNESEDSLNEDVEAIQNDENIEPECSEVNNAVIERTDKVVSNFEETLSSEESFDKTVIFRKTSLFQSDNSNDEQLRLTNENCSAQSDVDDSEDLTLTLVDPSDNLVGKSKPKNNRLSLLKYQPSSPEQSASSDSIGNDSTLIRYPANNAKSSLKINSTMLDRSLENILDANNLTLSPMSSIHKRRACSRYTLKDSTMMVDISRSSLQTDSNASKFVSSLVYFERLVVIYEVYLVIINSVTSFSF